MAAASAFETALREAKSALHDAGPGTGAILRSHHPELIRQEHAAWIVATELVHAATRSAAAIAAPFRKGPRTGQAVAARHLSFTTARRTLIATVDGRRIAVSAERDPALLDWGRHGVEVVHGGTVSGRERRIKTERSPFCPGWRTPARLAARAD